MFISQVRIKNFRILKDVVIPLKRHCILVGENNVGKTGLLELLDTILSPTNRGIQVSEQDFHHSVDPLRDPIEVTIELRPTDGDQFADQIRPLFYPHVDIESDGKERLQIHVEIAFAPEQDSFRATARFMKSDGKLDDGSFLPFRKHIPQFMINSIRDVRRELSSRQGLWSRLARTKAIGADNVKVMRELGKEVSEKLLAVALGEDMFEQMVDDFTNFLLGVLWSSDRPGAFEFSVVPEDFQDIIQKIELRLQNPGETRSSPVVNHGAGTHGLVVFALFAAYIKALGYREPILLVEEPEAHLHPQAQRALVRQITRTTAQSIISTHSTFVTDLVKPTQIVLLKRRGNQSCVRFIKDGYLSDAEERTLARYIKGSSSEFYYAKCVLLVEGEGDRSALPAFASSRGIDFDRLGISVVQVHGANFRPFMRLFAEDALDIPWAILCDNDKAITDCLKHAVDLGLIDPPRVVEDIETRRADLAARRILFYPFRGDFEWFLLSMGFVKEYEEAIADIHGVGALDTWISQTIKNDPDLATMARPQQIDRFIEKNRRKPELAAYVAAKITRDESDSARVPHFFNEVIDVVIEMANKEILSGSGGDSPS